MTRPSRYRLTDAEKDALLERQARLIERQAAIEALLARIAALEVELAKPRKISRNSHTPPSQDPGGRSGGDNGDTKPKKPRPSRPGVSRRLAATLDATVVRRAGRCARGADVSGLKQTCRRRYDHVDIPPVSPHATRVELHGGRCACGSSAPAPRRRRACRPARRSGRTSTPCWPTCITATTSDSSGWPGWRALFGLTICEGAIANALRRLETPLEAERAAIRAKLRAAQVVWSDETTTRLDGRLHWHWAFVTPEAVLHEITPRRARAVAEAVMGGHKPAVTLLAPHPLAQRLARAAELRGYRADRRPLRRVICLVIQNQAHGSRAQFRGISC